MENYEGRMANDEAWTAVFMRCLKQNRASMDILFRLSQEPDA